MRREGRRAPGSEWIKDHPAFLETAYDVTKIAVVRAYPWIKKLSPTLAERLLILGEGTLKGWIFNCQMCGQCILHSMGMTCPMTCPKKLRNGPCGGVRANGHCEVIPENRCIWVQAWERSQRLQRYADDLQAIQSPANHALQDTSAWINMIEERDDPPPGWSLAEEATPDPIDGDTT